MFNLIIDSIILIGIIITIGIWVRYIYSNSTPPKEDKLEELVNILREDRDNKLRKEKEQELFEYARKRKREMPTGGIRSSIGSGLEEKPIKANTHGELIPYGLSELDRAILEEFYK
jgi:hypothetical protein